MRDISIRAIDTLKEVDLIACEDTRRTKVLLAKYSIRTPTTSYHKFNVRSKTGHIISQLEQGKIIALVSDAGMPGISDPGQELIEAAAQAHIRVEVIPGPSAVISALSVSGMGIGRFAFEGFLPARASERKKRLLALAGEERTIVLYEAPHRLVRTMEDIKNNLGDRFICVARELTKKFEEVLRGRISELINRYSGIKPKGELVIVIEGKKGLEEPEAKKGRDGAKLLIGDLIRAGMTRSEAVKAVAKRLEIPKNELYRAVIRN